VSGTYYTLDEWLTDKLDNVATKLRNWLLMHAAKKTRRLQLRLQYSPRGIKGFKTLGIEAQPDGTKPGEITISNPKPAAVDNLIAQLRELVQSEIGDVDGQLRIRGWKSGEGRSPDLDWTQMVTEVEPAESDRGVMALQMLDRHQAREDRTFLHVETLIAEARHYTDRAVSSMEATIGSLTQSNAEKDKQIAAIATVRATAEAGASSGSTIWGPIAFLALAVMYKPLLKALGLPKHTSPQELVQIIVERGQKGMERMIAGDVPPSPTGRNREIEQREDLDPHDPEHDADTLFAEAVEQADAEASARDASASSAEPSRKAENPTAAAKPHRSVDAWSALGRQLGADIARHPDAGHCMEALLKAAGAVILADPDAHARIKDQNITMGMMLNVLAEDG
tara:strand:- start:433 stop:1617 length:1185 start_codon:yes stop_codon:yes gene_type:complete